MSHWWPSEAKDGDFRDGRGRLYGAVPLPEYTGDHRNMQQLSPLLRSDTIRLILPVSFPC